jgi:heme/copper-type cytochrome/quinol oxidase subunit 2
MGGIKDYTYQNIIFVHDFVYIFLILVFLIIIAYFIIIFVEYKIEDYKNYFKLFISNKIKEINVLKNLKKNKINTKTILKQNTLWYIQKYGIHLKSVLNQVHNLKLEIIWTFIPIFIILELIFPSLSLIADDEISNKASLYTVNVIGNQWYWTYELNTALGIIKQVSNLALIDELDLHNRNYARLLATTNAISIPVGLKTSFFITSNDVAHSWAIQGLGIKVDAIPGRINLKTVIASKIGLYTGMCSELCGIEHGFMPISLQVLTLNNWGYNLEYMSEKVLTYTDIKNIWYV